MPRLGLHAVGAPHTTGVPVKQTPLLHASAPLQKLASAQEVPFGTPTCMQPQLGSHTSRVQGFRSSGHAAGSFDDTQSADLQVSEPLQTFVSEHGAPSGRVTLKQPVLGTQVSMVQALPSSHRSCTPALHRPPKHSSVPLQAFES